MEYVALARAAGACAPDGRASGFETRVVRDEEAAAVLETVRPWYGEAITTISLRTVQRPEIELHAAFEGDHPIAVSMLARFGEWAYLGAAGTDPAHRGRGAQTALIRARLASAAERGASWCSCETNTAVPISLRNLQRCGFEDVIRWRVYRWDVAV